MLLLNIISELLLSRGMPDEAVAVVVAAVAAAVALALAVRKGKTVFFSYMSQQHLP